MFASRRVHDRPRRWLHCAGLALAAALVAGCAPTIRARRPLQPDSLEANGHERDVDLVHVDLDLDIAFDERRIAGEVRHTVRALVPNTRTMRVHARDLTIEAVRDADGRALRFDSSGEVVTIHFAEPLARGAEATVAIRYDGRPSEGLHFRTSSKDADGFAPQVWSQGQPHDTRAWIPIWDYPNDRTTFEGRFTVGHGMTAVSNGELVGVEPRDGERRTFHWRFDDTLVTYLIAVAAGQWECYVDDRSGVRLEAWVGPGTGADKAWRAFGETGAMIAYFAERLDEPFPYGRYAQVAASGFVTGGMENATLSILADHVIGEEHEIADLDGDPRLLVAHEAAHQWFGDLVTCLGWSHLWLNEAWASFLELEFQGHVDGAASRALWYERYREAYLARGERTRRPLAETWRTQTSDVRTHHEYDKGPWVLRMIRDAIGEEAFWQGARLYLDRHAEGLVTTADFQRALFDASGKNVEGLIEQWVEAGGHPRFRVRFSEREARAGEGVLRLDVRQVQETDELVPLFDVPVDVDLVGARGAVRHRLRVSRARETFELPLTEPLEDVVFDAGGKLLCEIDLDKPADMWARQALDRDDAAGRWRAVRALDAGASGRAGQCARATFLDVARSDPEPLLRALAAAGCRFTGAAPTLVHLLEADPSPHVRRAAAESLGSFEIAAPLSGRLNACLTGETSPAVRARLRTLAGKGRPVGVAGDE